MLGADYGSFGTVLVLSGESTPPGFFVWCGVPLFPHYSMGLHVGHQSCVRVGDLHS